MDQRYPARRLSFNSSTHVQALNSDNITLLLRDSLEQLGAIGSPRIRARAHHNAGNR